MFFGIEKVMSLKGVINLATCLGKKTTIKARFLKILITKLKIRVRFGVFTS